MQTDEGSTNSRPGGGPLAEDALSQAFYRDRNVAEEGTGPGEATGKILRKLLRYLAPVFLLLLALDLVLRWVFPPEALLPYTQKEMACYTLKVERYLEKPPPDVLFLGSSRIRDALVPMVFSTYLSKYWGRPVRTFNLGLAGAKAEECYTLVDAHLPDRTPPYVVFGFSGSEVSQVHESRYAPRYLWDFSSFLEYLGRTDLDKFQVKYVEYYLEQVLCRWWYLFKHRDGFSSMIAGSLASLLGWEGDLEDWVLGDRSRNQRRMIEHVLAEDGFRHILPPMWNLAEKIEKHKEIPIRDRRELNRDPDLINEESVRLLGKIVSRLRGMGARVALAETPPSPYLQELNPERLGTGFRRRMAEVAEELDVLFVTLPPEETGLTNAFYGDPSHFTLDGAKRYTYFLFEKLKAAGFFKEGGP